MLKWWKQKRCRHEYHSVVEYISRERLGGYYGGRERVTEYKYTTMYCPHCDHEVDMKSSDAIILLEKQKNMRQAKENKND